MICYSPLAAGFLTGKYRRRSLPEAGARLSFASQYFTDEGDSLHYNYWSSNFGEEGSHGCLGLSLDDAAWLWDWAAVGTIVNVHG